jgi:hypothetical protein
MYRIFSVYKYLLPLVLTAWCVVLLAQKIDLPLADIGRHLENGSVLLHGSNTEKRGLLYTNYYSYTEPNHEFVNHHWLSGVVFYSIHQIAGFKGLSVFYITLVSAAFLLFYLIAQKRGGSAIASVLAVLVLPIVASRTEIRPEGFTYLFMAVFFFILWRRQEFTELQNITNLQTPTERGAIKQLWLLPVLMLFWVNLHIGFIFGFLILGAFWLRSFIYDSGFIIQNSKSHEKRKQFKYISIVSLVCVLAGLVNPFFIKGLLYPLNIFREYGYLIVENQSVMFLERLGMGTALYFGLFKFLLGLALGSCFVIFLIIFRKKS